MKLGEYIQLFTYLSDSFEFSEIVPCNLLFDLPLN